jgi:Putative Ig domain
MLRRNSLLLFASLAVVSLFISGCGCNSSSSSLTITGTLSGGAVGVAYSGTLSVSGGTSPYTWTVTGLPQGVTESGNMTATITFSGTPTTPGSYMVSVTVTDSKGHTATYNVTITIATLTVTTTSLPNGIVGTTYTVTLAASNGTTPYTWAETSGGALPGGLMLTPSSGVISGTPTTAGTFGPYTFTVTDANDATAVSGPLTIVVTSSSTAVCTPRGNEGALTTATPYAFLVQGDNLTSESDLGVAIAGSFTPNANGTITAADVDYNAEISDGEQSLVVDLAGSSYSLGSDGRGCLYLAFSGLTPVSKKAHATKGVFHAKGAHANAAGRKRRRAVKAHPAQASESLASLTLSFALGNKDGSGVYHTGRIMEFDNTAEGGTISAGMMHLQDTTAFVLSALKANFAFGVEGWGIQGDSDFRIAVAGTFANSGGVLSSGFSDVTAGGTPSGELSGGSGQIGSTISSTTGRGTVTYSIPNADGEGDTLTTDFAIYVINATDFYMVSSDGVEDVPLLSGRALATNAAFGAAPLNGYYLDAASGFDDDNGGNYVEVGTLYAKSDNTVPTATLYINDIGDTGTEQYPNMTYTVDTAGRFSASSESLTYPLVGYLTSGGDVGENISAFLVAGDELAQASSSGVLVNLLTNVAPSYTMTNIAGTYAFGTAEDVDGGNGSEVGTVTNSGSGASGTFTSIVDICAIEESNESDVTGNGTVAINADGSGTFTGGTFHGSSLMFVTNGSQIYAIDYTDIDPLLYVFDEGIQPE